MLLVCFVFISNRVLNEICAFQYLSTPESQSLRCDLIRYICAVIHPSNEVLCSDIIPRWAVIGWLLTTCTVSSVCSISPFWQFWDSIWLLSFKNLQSNYWLKISDGDVVDFCFSTFVLMIHLYLLLSSCQMFLAFQRLALASKAAFSKCTLFGDSTMFALWFCSICCIQLICS